jgi:hypothetical protein
MEDLRNEIATLQKGMEGLSIVIEDYKRAVEILSLKLEELQDRKIEVSEEMLTIRINKFFDDNLPYSTDFSWSDGGFTADFELDVHDMLHEEMGTNWQHMLAEDIVTLIQDNNK